MCIRDRSSKESVRLSRLRYDVGIATLKDVLVRQSELSSAKSKNINAIYNYNLNLDELERLTFLEISKNCIDNNNNKALLLLLSIQFLLISRKVNLSNSSKFKL